MSNLIEQNCPVCQSIVFCKKSGWFSKVIKFPNFCGSCGTKLFHECPSCHQNLPYLTNNCIHCSERLYVPEYKGVYTSVSQKTISEKAQKQLEQLKQDLYDVNLYVEEMFRLVVRLNPISQQIFHFDTILEEIETKNSSNEISSVIDEAVNSIHLDYLYEQFDEFNRSVISSIEGLFDERTLFEKELSHYRIYVNITNISTEVDIIKQKMQDAIQFYNERDFRQIKNHFERIKENAPKYQSIITRTGFADFAIGFTSGLLGTLLAGPLGYAASDQGLRYWENWRDASDKEFIDWFSSLIKTFIDYGYDLADYMESSCQPVINEAIHLYSEQTLAIIEGLNNAALDGINIDQAYQAIRTFGRNDSVNLDQDHFSKIILYNLREKGLSIQSEENLVYLLNLR